MKNLACILVLLLVHAFANGQTSSVPTERTLLWEVSGNGLQQPSFLFGTLHLMCPNELEMPAIVKEKFKATRQLYLEIDMDDPNMMTEMMKGMQMHNDTTLQLLLKNDFDSISHLFKQATGLPLHMLSTTKPLLLMAMIYPSLLGCQPVSWEGEFVKMATERSMEINGLEFIADQVKVFEVIPYAVQANMLMRTLYNMDSSKMVFAEMIKMYKEKDILKMHSMTTSDVDFGAFENALLNNRNRNWIPEIGEQAKKMPTFFAFGAGHLAGDEGVINLLRKNGFTVKPVMYKD